MTFALTKSGCAARTPWSQSQNDQSRYRLYFSMTGFQIAIISRDALGPFKTVPGRGDDIEAKLLHRRHFRQLLRARGAESRNRGDFARFDLLDIDGDLIADEIDLAGHQVGQH